MVSATCPVAERAGRAVVEIADNCRNCKPVPVERLEPSEVLVGPVPASGYGLKRTRRGIRKRGAAQLGYTGLMVLKGLVVKPKPLLAAHSMSWVM